MLSNVRPVFVPWGDGDDDEEGREERLPSCYDYVMHFLTVFWKVLFACVPPTEYWNGWACFLVPISVIGLLTAVIGDLASHFGCTVGLRDTVTAVVFVALGTSIPGEWKSSSTVWQRESVESNMVAQTLAEVLCPHNQKSSQSINPVKHLQFFTVAKTHFLKPSTLFSNL